MTHPDLEAGRPVVGVDWGDVAQMLDVDVTVGLSQAEATSRLQSHGANRLTASKVLPPSYICKS